MSTSGTIADGQVKTSASVIYSVPTVGVEHVVVTYLGMLNTNAAEQTIFIYLRRKGTTERKMRRFVLKQNQHGQWISRNEDPTLSPGDAVLMETTTAAAVDYIMCGTVAKNA